MTDDRLLELAAKAAGLPWDQWVIDGDDSWNPLTDDGDALRLAVSLDLVVYCSRPSPSASSPGGSHAHVEFGRADPYAATRRAIVRAAAEIGRQKK